MKLWKVMLVGILGIMLSAVATAQTYDLRFRDAGNTGTQIDVAIQIRAVGTPFTLGTSNFVFRYDTSGLEAPLLLDKHRFSGDKYDSIDVRVSSQVSVNIYLKTPSVADTVDTTFQDVVTLRFAFKQPNQSSFINWVRTGGAPTVVFVGDDSAEAAPGTLENTTVTGTVDVAEGQSLPKQFALEQNYPNPFNPSTTIQFALPRESRVVLEVYNLLGQRVATLVDDVRPAGYHTVRFDAAKLASGIYFYRLHAGEQSFLKKMMVLK